jgi:dihydroorotate dehydrogenase electron transfer subunit
MKHLLKIISNNCIADKIFELKLQGDFKTLDFSPGKFLHIKCAEGIDPLLRRPMSICNINDNLDEMTVLYRAEGQGTKALAKKNIGESLDVLAPLGEPFRYEHLPHSSRILLVGGGIGVPPLYYLGRRLKENGHEIHSILGFNSAKDVFYENEFKTLGPVQISTIDGSHGYKGYVTNLLGEDWDVLYSCGPTAMLKALQNLIPKDKEAYVSLEERMGCGVGACLACICKPSRPEDWDKSYLRVCTEGPVFPMHAVAL